MRRDQMTSGKASARNANGEYGIRQPKSTAWNTVPDGAGAPRPGAGAAGGAAPPPVPVGPTERADPGADGVSPKLAEVGPVVPPGRDPDVKGVAVNACMVTWATPKVRVRTVPETGIR